MRNSRSTRKKRPSGPSNRKRREGVAARPEASEPKRPWLIPALLVLVTLATFWPVLRNEFVNYDDRDYVFANPMVSRGLTPEGVRWAFTTGHAANWHPLTWLSHMADASLFGLNPTGHHAVNLLLHAANTVLLFLLFYRLTGAAGRSGFAAALFAVHPAHVESVAWVAERKDVLSTAFWLATMAAYVWWFRKRGTGRYLVVLALFAAGLMSKPMLVSLPIVLLLVDYWPLGRYDGVGPADRIRLVLEKVPLFFLAAAASVVTFLVQRAGGAVRSFNHPVGTRVGNALVSIVGYLRMLFWPKLAVFYPYPREIPVASVVVAAVLIAGISGAAIRLRRKAPFFFFGWFWFLVTLFPVIGLVQVGEQAMADRYTYVPFIGLFVAIAWGVPALTARWPRRRPLLRLAAVAVVLALAVAASAQVRVWKDTETLFLHALETTKDNYLAHTNLANQYSETGRAAEALPHLLEAARIRPDEPQVHVNLGYALLLLDRRDDAARSFQRALELRPGQAVALNNLARIRFLDGDVADAVRLYRAAVASKPDWAEGRRRFAIALLMEGETGSALDQLERAVALDPADSEARSLLEGVRALGRTADPRADALRRFLADSHREAADALRRRGRNAQAEVQIRKARELDPAGAETPPATSP